MEFTKNVEPYSVLAAGYDLVMAHVDYEAWADYVDHLIDRHHDAPNEIVELGCGTGSLALELERRGYRNMLATDRSQAMLDVAERKAREAGARLRFARKDFLDFSLENPADVLLLLYDGLNYLLEPENVARLFRQSYGALAANGVFLFDQSTPANSLRNELDFADRGEHDLFSYERTSRYDAETRLHTTTLDLIVRGRRFRERHVQRAYTIDEIRKLVTDAGLHVEAAYDGFSLDAATPKSERVHWVVRRQSKEQ